jgi:hypothetical protein
MEFLPLQSSRTLRPVWRLLSLPIVAGCLCVPAAYLWTARADNPQLGDAVGAIEGDAISVQGPMSVDSANGLVRTILRSGSDVQVKSGSAHIDLVEGGNITICGPSHFSVLKSGGSLTIALDRGTIHGHVEGQLSVTIYTAQIQAHPIAIGNAAEDFLVGLDNSGTMCIRPSKGAVRIEQQLTGQNLLIPQNGDVSLTNGQLETLKTSAGQCNCELQLSAKIPEISTQVSGLASSEELKQRAAQAKPADPAPQTVPPVKEEPVYQVFMPPLHYDSNAKVQQDYDPSLIVLVRRARVRPTLIFQGKVEGEPVVAAQSAPPAPPAAMQKTEAAKRPEDDTTWNRVRTFFHKLWSPSS